MNIQFNPSELAEVIDALHVRVADIQGDIKVIQDKRASARTDFDADAWVEPLSRRLDSVDVLLRVLRKLEGRDA